MPANVIGVVFSHQPRHIQLNISMLYYDFKRFLIPKNEKMLTFASSSTRCLILRKHPYKN